MQVDVGLPHNVLEPLKSLGHGKEGTVVSWGELLGTCTLTDGLGPSFLSCKTGLKCGPPWP